MMLLALPAPMPAPVVYTGARDVAMAYLVVALVALFVASRFLARRTQRPAVILGPAIYLGILHMIALVGLATSIRFENGIAQMTLFTFPFSMSLFNETGLAGFATGRELAGNYIRYVLHFGGWNALILAGFLALVVPPRPRLGRAEAGRPANDAADDEVRHETGRSRRVSGGAARPSGELADGRLRGAAR